MPDEPFARLEERIVALAHRLDRTDNTCEQRSSRHVEHTLYNSERQGMRDEIAELGRRLSEHERKSTETFAELRAEIHTGRREAADTVNDLARKIARDRQWAVALVATVVLTLLGYLVAVLT